MAFSLPNPLNALLQDWRQLLRLWAQSGALSQAAWEALLLEGDPQQLRELLGAWSEGDFSQLPPVAVLPAAAMPGAAGAYASSTGTIYLNREWLQRASRQQALAVLSEELGHHLDALLNRSDTPGDEGELFAALLQGAGRISPQQRQRMLAENDQGIVLLNGQALAVEQAAVVVTSTPIRVASPGRTGGEFQNAYAFAALKSDGSVVTWGNLDYGGDSSEVASQLFSGVQQIFSTVGAFAALKSDGSVVTWGDLDYGGDSSEVASQLGSGVQQVFSTDSAFAALKSDGSVVTWGDLDDGGDSSEVASQLFSGVQQIFSTYSAFAALKSDGSVVTWGDLDDGGDSSEVASQLGSGVVAFANPFTNDRLVLDAVPTITLAVTPGSVAEDGATNLVYTFTRSGLSTSALTVNYSITGSAASTDYTGATPGTGKTISFAAGSSTATLIIDPTADTIIEPDETVALTLAAGTGYTIGTTAAVTGTISNDDPRITLALATPASVAEDGATNLVYTFTRTGATTTALTVNFAVGGTASLSSDYVQSGAASFTATTGTVTFAANSSTATVTIDPTADTAIEADETVALTLAAGTGYTIGTTTAVTGTISNDDPRITLALATPAVAEDGATNLVYTFTRTGATTTALTVNFAVGGTASLSSDYVQSGAASFTATTGTVTFAANSSTATVTIDPTADTAIEADETVALTLAAGTGYTIGTPAAVTGTISNDDPRITLVVAPAAVAEDGTTNLIYTFTRTGATTTALTVNFAVSGSATLGADYSQSGAASFSATAGTVTFAAGSNTATVTVDPTADADIEPDETVALTLAAGTGYTIGTSTAVTGTISNDDPRITLAVVPAAVAEDGTTNLIYTFTRTGATTTALTVNFAVSGSATLGADYSQSGAASFSATAGTVTFAAGSNTATVTVDPTADADIEPDETVALTLAAGTGYTIGTSTAVTGTISNDDPRITLAVVPAAVAEDGTTNLIYTFTRTGATTTALTVNFAVSGSATLGADYSQSGAASFSATAGTVTFAAGSNTATVTVDPTADADIEPDETVALTLAAGTGYTIGTTTAVTGTISNDDPRITLALATPAVAEDGATNLVYTFTRSGLSTSALTVNYSITGSAASTDYTGATPGSGKTISFAAGSSTATLIIDPTADTAIEPDETVALTLTAGLGYTIGTTAAVTGTISNDDPRITLALATPAVAEDGSTNLIYTFSRTGATTTALTVNFAVGGTATLTSDYLQSGAASFTATTGTVTFAANSSTATVTIDPAADTTIEPDETVALTLAAGTGYTIGTTAAITGTISNDDLPAITLAVTPAAVLEDGTTNLVYTFSRTGPTTTALTVNYGVGGTATLGADYSQNGAASFSATAGTVTFAAGSSTATVTIDPTADADPESDEIVALTLAAGTGYTIGTPAAVTGTIRNDDPRITLALATPAVAEDGNTNLVYTFTRTGATTTALTVNFAVGGTASLGTDYSQSGASSFTATTGTVTFAANSSTATVTIDPTADTTIEPDETVALTLAAGTGYTIGTPAAVTGTISNDDPRITLALATPAVAEDGSTNLVYTFTRTGATTTALTVNFAVGGTASLGTDYSQSGASSFTATTGTVTFAANSSTATVTIDPAADTTIEPDETVALTLAAGTGYTIGTPAAVTGTIRNDDPRITLALATPAVAEDGTTNLVYTFSRTGDAANALTVNYNIAGTAGVADYFGATPGAGKIISFLAGSSTVTLTITPIADATVEADESVALTLVAGTGYTIGTTAAVTGTIRNDDISSAISYTMAPEDSSLTLTGTNPVNGTGNNLANTITGNSANNQIAGAAGKDILTGGGGTADSDTFLFSLLNDSLLVEPISGTGGYFDEITDYNSKDRIDAPSSVGTGRRTATIGTATSITPQAVASLLTSSAFPANAVVAFTVSNQTGTFLALNDGRAGFQASTDGIVFLRNYSISAANSVEIF